MAAYSILFRASVRKDLDRIPQTDLRRILDRIALLALEPRGSGCEKLSAQERYRVRQGRYRILYTIEDERLVIVVVRIAHRKDAYRM